MKIENKAEITAIIDTFLAGKSIFWATCGIASNPTKAHGAIVNIVKILTILN